MTRFARTTIRRVLLGALARSSARPYCLRLYPYYGRARVGPRAATAAPTPRGARAREYARTERRGARASLSSRFPSVISDDAPICGADDAALNSGARPAIARLYLLLPYGKKRGCEERSRGALCARARSNESTTARGTIRPLRRLRLRRFSGRASNDRSYAVCARVTRPCARARSTRACRGATPSRVRATAQAVCFR